MAIALSKNSSDEISEFSVARDWHSDRRSPVRWLFSHIWRHRLHIFGILIGSLGNAFAGQLMPMLIGRAFNSVNSGVATTTTLALAALGILASQLIRSVLQMWRNFSSEVIGQRIERDVRAELYASLIGKSMAFHDRQRIGDVMARATNDVREVNFFMNPGLNMVLGSGAFLFFPIFFSFGIKPQLAILPLLYIVFYVLAVRSFLNRLSPATEKVRGAFGAMNAALAESIEGIETVKGAAQERREIDRFAAAVARWRDASVTQADVEAVYLPGLVLGVTLAIGVSHALLLYLGGSITIGDVVAYSGLLTSLRFPTFATQFAYPQVASGVSSARRILEMMNAQTLLDQNRHGYSEPMRGDVEFTGVTFGYGGREDARPALRGVTMRAKAGQTVAIVGQTGAGKSTLTKLINRIYDADAGVVCVDGVDVRDWDLAVLRRQISYIEQDIFLFSRTVAENIAFGVPGATREQVERAARAAQAHDFIMTFKDGYETVVGERGVTLSGGQRQRLAIARAFLTDPRILILDDSTSAIDSATEDEIQRAMFEIAQGRTTFIITHRLSQIRWADVIVVLKQGSVEAVGTHEELLAQSKAYAQIFGS